MCRDCCHKVVPCTNTGFLCRDCARSSLLLHKNLKNVQGLAIGACFLHKNRENVHRIRSTRLLNAGSHPEHIPEHEPGQHYRADGPGEYGIAAGTMQAGEAFLEEFGESQEGQQRQGEDKKRIVAQRLEDMEVQQLMQGALGAAAGAAEAGQHLEGTAREGRPGGVKAEVYKKT